MSRRSTVLSFVLVLAVYPGSLLGCVKSGSASSQQVGPSELLQRGVYLADQGDDFGAEQYFVAARSAGYPEQRVVRELVQVCVNAGRLEQALAHAQNYLDRYPDDWALRHVLASIQFAKGDRLGARHELELVLAEHPEHAESTFLLALVLRDGFADFPGAAAVFQRYLQLTPDGVHATETRAWLRRSVTFPKAQEAQEATSPAALTQAEATMAAPRAAQSASLSAPILMSAPAATQATP